MPPSPVEYPPSRVPGTPKLRGALFPVAAALSVVIIGLLLLSGVTVVLTPASTAPTPPRGPVISPNIPSPIGHARVVNPPSIVQRATSPIPTRSICLLAQLPGCPALVSASPGVHSLASPSPSSWHNLTPAVFPSSYPPARFYPATTYDPLGARVLVFGGFDIAGGYLNDTWAYAGGTWRQLVSPTSCTPATCPVGREGGEMAYDLADQEAVLFGGYTTLGGFNAVLGDTWVFAHGAWTNITATAGTAPTPRAFGAMTWASAEGYVLYYAGSDVYGTSTWDTWTFLHGKWTNISSTLTERPSAVAGASIADSPTGYTMLFGGIANGTYIQNRGGGSACSPWVQWWFSGGQWTAAKETCVGVPRPLTGAGDLTGPCGRIGAGLMWSPKNQHFVLFGGSSIPGTSCGLTGSASALNDTWLYLGAPGAGFQHWFADTTPGAPSDRQGVGYASDYADGYALVIGGLKGTGYLTNDTWRYYAVVSASLSGPLDIQNGAISFNEFKLVAFGGSGNLDYIFNITGLKTGNALTGTGQCATFTDQQGRVMPASAVQLISCTPASSSYNVFRLSVTVWDSQNSTLRAYSNWTFTSEPPESLILYSKYTGVFYEGFSLTNVFGVYAQINNQPVSHISGTLEGIQLSFSHSNSSNLWWNASFDMGGTGPGAVVQVTVSSSDWSLNTSMALSVVGTPGWMQQLAGLAGVIQSSKTTGKAAFGDGFLLDQKVPLPIGKLFNFSIPIPLLSGNYSLVPNINLEFSENSSGEVSISGAFDLSTPDISLGVFKLKISVELKLTGVLHLSPQNGDLTIDWVSATAVITITGDFSAEIPIWGFGFSIFGYNCSIGFTLNIDIAPSVALSILMTPSDKPADDMLPGVALMVTQVFGQLSLPIEVDAKFGFVVGDVSLGGKVSLDITFQISPGQFQPNNLWVNGSIFGKLTILIWSGTWNIVGPGVIYHWVPSGLAPARPGASGVGYDNGSDAAWGLNPRSYNSSGFDRLLWAAAATQGVAVSDVYPSASPSGTGAYNGAYLFYTDDRVSQPVRSGLTFSGLKIDASSNSASTISAPIDPGFLVSNPVATTLSDGSLYVLWDALPVSETAGSSPAGVHSILLHGAPFYAPNQSWGPVRSWTTWGVAESYALDPSAASPTVCVLVSPTLIPVATTPERLLSYSLATGLVLTNASVRDLSRVIAVRGSLARAIVGDEPGNYSIRDLSTGAVVPLAFSPPSNWSLVGETFVPGSASLLLLRYRSPTAGAAVLVDIASVAAQATLGLAGEVRDVQGVCGGSGCYVYASNRTGVEGWQVGLTGTVASVAFTMASGISTFGLAESGRSLVIYALVPEGNGSSGLKDLFLAESGSSLPPVTAGAPPAGGGGTPPASPKSTPFNLALYLGLPIVVAAAILTIIAISRRRRGPRPTASPPSSSSAPVTPAPDRPE